MKYFAEYACGCVSQIDIKKKVLEYCAIHGRSIRYLWPVITPKPKKRKQGRIPLSEGHG